MSLEIWKDVEGYEGKYQVSTWGRVRGRKGILKPYLNYNGYEKVELWNGDIGRKFRVHRLVAMAFIPNPNELPQVNHKDGNRTNNSVTNLEWVTNAENAQKARELRMMKQICEGYEWTDS